METKLRKLVFSLLFFSVIVSLGFSQQFGNLIYEYGADKQRTRQEYMNFLNIVKIFGIPFYTVVGNHEIAGAQGQKYYKLLLI